MRGLTLLAGLLTVGAATAAPTDATAATAPTLDSLTAQAEAASWPAGSCDPSKVQVRREWGSLSHADRKAYTDAVLCLQKKPPLTPLSFAPGVRSRFDDFVATHINQTLSIHFTGNFLSWHRYFTWAYEQALRNECGYTGTQPYWNWGLYSSSPQTSPIFNGDAYSMGGSGTPTKHPGYTVNVPGLPIVTFPAGVGGGCVNNGPFVNMSVNLGPVGSLYLPPNGNGLGYNPRCLVRDVNPTVNSEYASNTNIFNLLFNSSDIATFQGAMQGQPPYIEALGVHAGGHYTIGGDPGNDFFVSPGDPMFYLHHGMIDRVWWIWQNLNLPARQNAIAGTRTFLNNPPSPNTTLSDLIYLGDNNQPARMISELMSTTKGPFCYIYE